MAAATLCPGTGKPALGGGITSFGLSGRSGVGAGLPIKVSLAPLKGDPRPRPPPSLQPAARKPSAATAAKPDIDVRDANMVNRPDFSLDELAMLVFRRFYDWI